MTEKRHYTRINFAAPVQLQWQQQQWNAELLDVSLNGVLISRPALWDLIDGSELALKIQLPQSDVTIEMTVKQAHHDTERLGFHCLQIELASIEHLRRLIEFNTGDSGLLHRELSQLVE